MMVRVSGNGVYLFNGREIVEDTPEQAGVLEKRLGPGGSAEASRAAARQGTMAYGILAAHHRGAADPGTPLALSFDALASHDITFVNIIQTARVSGLDAFPVPYYLTNCHNSLCAVGGTINEDDHLFGLSAARRYGGIYVPPHLAVSHSFIREEAAGCGRMILGSDSHTRYGALGTMGVGEGGGELVKQLLRQSYDMPWPRIVLVYLRGRPRRGLGPQDLALALVGAVFKGGLVKNAVLEFAGPGIGALPIDFRSGVDVMTTETTCWSSIWETDGAVQDFLALHGRAGDFRELAPGPCAYYDALIEIDLSTVKPMIALPFHPSNVYEIDEVLENGEDIFAQVEKEAAAILENPQVPLKLRDKIEGKGRIRVDQGIIAGCAGGTFDNIMAAAAILGGGGSGSGPGIGPAGGPPGGPASGPTAFSLSVYPGSQPVMLELTRNGAAAALIERGVVLRSAFCGPCFGAGDVPAHNSLSIRHTTRNFPNREGSRPGGGQIASVALMDARSIAATALNGGYLRSAETLDFEERPAAYHYDDGPYRARVYRGAKPDRGAALVCGPNITGWPEMDALGEDLLLKIVAFITDPVTTTDELIPSGETSSFRSNPLGLAEYTLSRKDPAYVGRAKLVREAALALRKGHETGFTELETGLPELEAVLTALRALRALRSIEAMATGGLAAGGMAEPGVGEPGAGAPGTKREASGGAALPALGSAIFARKPGDGSAREQAASCQRVLGGAANFANEYATKRYRSNLINWGILPLTVEGAPFANGDYVFIPGIRKAVEAASPVLKAWVIPASETAFTARHDRGAVPAPGGPEAGTLPEARPLDLKMPELNAGEREIMLAGSLINYNRKRSVDGAAGLR
jgi:aconitate hydratase